MNELNKTQGYIKLFRSMRGWKWYKDSNTKSLFIELLLSASHYDTFYRGIPVKRGQLIVGRKTLFERTGISEQSIRTSLMRLKATNEIVQKSTPIFSIITITNYDSYQLDECQANQQLTNHQPTANHIQELKEVKELKKRINISLGETPEFPLHDRKIKKYHFSEEHYRIAKEFHELKSKTHGNLNAIANANLEAWADEIRKLEEIDGKNLELIEKVLSFALGDSFWINNLQSLQGIRNKNKDGISKFEMIEIKFNPKGVEDYELTSNTTEE